MTDAQNQGSASLLTPDEEALLMMLGAAYNRFVNLPEMHPSDRREFMYAIHQAQNIVLARPAWRRHGEPKPIT